MRRERGSRLSFCLFFCCSKSRWFAYMRDTAKHCSAFLVIARPDIVIANYFTAPLSVTTSKTNGQLFCHVLYRSLDTFILTCFAKGKKQHFTSSTAHKNMIILQHSLQQAVSCCCFILSSVKFYNITTCLLKRISCSSMYNLGYFALIV